MECNEVPDVDNLYGGLRVTDRTTGIDYIKVTVTYSGMCNFITSNIEETIMLRRDAPTWLETVGARAEGYAVLTNYVVV